jgi:hypothetical protein
MVFSLVTQLNFQTVAVFADETAIYISHSDVSIVPSKCCEPLAALLMLMENKNYSIQSQCIYFSKKRSQRYLPSTDLNVDGSTVPWSDSVKYLSVFPFIRMSAVQASGIEKRVVDGCGSKFYTDLWESNLWSGVSNIC